MIDLSIFLYSVFDFLITDIMIIILMGVLFFRALKPQAPEFSVMEVICIAASAVDVFMTGSYISAIIFALLLGPRIPLFYTGIICVILSAIEFFMTGGIAPMIVTALVGGYILFKNRKHLASLIPSFSIPFISICIGHTTTNKRYLFYTCFLIFWLLRGATFAATSFWEDEIRFVRNLFSFTREVGEWIAESMAHPEIGADDVYRSRRSMEENQLLRVEDPEEVRILRSNSSAYFREPIVRTPDPTITETIELRVTQTQIQPGERVHFTAIPSRRTPSLGSSVFLISNPLGYTTTLNRSWFGRYHGSVRFRTSDAGAYEFSILTRPRYDEKEGKMVIHASNTVIVSVGVQADVGTLEAQIAADVRDRHMNPNRNRAIEFPRSESAPPRPQSDERLRPVSPPDGFVARVGERLQLEVVSFDSSFSEEYTFGWSRWSIHRVNPETGRRGSEVAFLRRGNSERAEWTPRGTGTFEWEVIYFYSMGPRSPGRANSPPQRIVVVD